MALTDEVTSRYSSTLLKSLTNPDDSSATTVDTTRLGLAATDAQNAFVTYGQITYDNTDARHVMVAVQGVVAFLKERKTSGGRDARAELEQFFSAIRELASTTTRARVVPKSNSDTEPSDELRSDGTSPRPLFDKEHFDRVTPDAPRSGTDDWVI